MFKKIFVKSNLRMVASFLLGVLLVTFTNLYFSDKRESEIKPVTQDIEIVWPLQDVNLFDNQVFIVELDDAELDDQYQVFWNLEGSSVEGQMMLNEGQFKSEVNVSGWDWKKDGKYKLAFVVRDKNDTLVGYKSLVINIGDTPVIDVVISEEEPAPDTALSTITDLSHEATVYKPVVTKPVPQVVRVPAAVEEALKIEWIPADKQSSQKFIYNISGYDSNEVTAFWNAEGGHRNLIYPANKKPNFTAAINVFGWRWLDKGPYKIHFGIADKDTSEVIATESFDIFWQGEPGNSEIEIKSKGVTNSKLATESKSEVAVEEPEVKVKDVVSEPVEKAEPKIVSTVQLLTNQPIISNQDSNYFTKTKLYKPAKLAVEEALKNSSDSATKTALQYILSQPNSIWLNGDGYDSNEYIQQVLTEAKSRKEIPAFILYNIPNRDCGSHSSGGTDSVAGYKAWIDRIANNLRGEEAVVVVEPDALPMLNCLQGDARADRIEMIKYAVEKIVPVSKNVMVYIDAGHPQWVGTNEIAERLKQVSVAKARGFALNVSNYGSTNDNIIYGNIISNLLDGKKYIIDSSRNGNGESPDRQWCNPSGRALGESPSLSRGQRGNLDAILWLKFPGESDGYCNGGPGAGAWWTEYAVDLYKNR